MSKNNPTPLRRARHNNCETLNDACSLLVSQGVTVNESMLSKIERGNYWPKRDLLTALKNNYNLSSDDILFPVNDRLRQR